MNKIKLLAMLLVIITSPVWLVTFFYNFIKNLIIYIWFSIIGLYNVPKTMLIAIENELFLMAVQRKLKKD